MPKKFLFLIFIALFFYALSVPLPADAGNWRESALQQLRPVNQQLQLTEDIKAPISGVLKAALAFVGTIFLVLTIYAGILWMTAAGKEEQVGTARKIITASVIGLFIVMSSYAITQFVTTKLGAGGGPGGAGEELGGLDPETACARQGGMCVLNNENPQQYASMLIGLGAEPGGNWDPAAPCDPDSVGAEDPFNGQIGTCGRTGVCCELADWVEGGRGKCTRMGGSCYDDCPAGSTDIGDCDIPAVDDLECCLVNE